MTGHSISLRSATSVVAVLAVLVGVLAVAGCGNNTPANTAQNTQSNSAQPAPATSSEFANPVLGMCPVMSEPVGDNPVVVEHAGKKYQLCCKDCVADFKADPEKYIVAGADKASGSHDHGTHNH